MFLKSRSVFSFATKYRSCYKVVSKPPQTDVKTHDPKALINQIRSRIKTSGPITVADYMKEVLINPCGGYYMHKEVFGETGDFVTSPELGQLFGEMIAVWFLNEWTKVGAPKPYQIVELGPGRGTLCEDVLRVFERFGALNGGSVHLVEASPHFGGVQAQRLCLNSQPVDNEPFYRRGVTFHGLPMYWYRHLSDVPTCYTLLVAHEFFDALPVHKFQRTTDGWREILVDLDRNDKDGAVGFTYVVSRSETPAVKLFLQRTEKREHVEVSPESMIVTQQIAERLEHDGGLALIADYGHDGTGTDTFRAFKKHKLHDPLVEPGSADLTADVDFGALKRAALRDDKTIVYGPVSQTDFLLRMGIKERLKRLEEKAQPKQIEALRYGCDMMIDSDKMGDRFKFISIFPAVLEPHLNKYPVVGFS